MNTYRVKYMINHEILTEKVKATNGIEAIKLVNDKLKNMRVSFVIYGCE